MDAPKVVAHRRSLMKIYRSNRSRSHPGARRVRRVIPRARRGAARRGRGRAGSALSVSARAAAAMGNQHSASHNVHKPSKNVRWKTAGKPSRHTLTPGAPRRPSRVHLVIRGCVIFLFLKRLRAAIPKAWHNKTNRKTVRVHVTIITRLILKGVLCQMAYTGSTVTEQRLTPDSTYLI